MNETQAVHAKAIESKTSKLRRLSRYQDPLLSKPVQNAETVIYA